MVFLTFGHRALVPGLILDGHLYQGRRDMAGEAGHIRLSQTGPVGLERPAPLRDSAAEAESAEWDGPWQKKEDWRRRESIFSTAAGIAEAADQGDELALEIFRRTGRMLGLGLSMLVDILNPELIVIGSIFLARRSG